MAEREGIGLAWRLDPRLKIIVLIVACVSATICRDVLWGSLLFASTAVLVVVVGRPRLAMKFAIGYVVILAFVGVITGINPEIGARVALIFQSIRSAFPPFLLATLLVTTTKTGDLVASLYSCKLPRALVIPLAVGIRFFPTFAEEFRFVSDSAKLQGLRLAPATVVRHPVALSEALVVPIMLRSAKIAEELAAAAVARGIEKPGERTSFNRLAFSKADGVLLVVFTAVCVTLLVTRSHLWGELVW